MWLVLVGAAPGNVTTVDGLLRWVREQKARLVVGDHEGDSIFESNMLDVLFEECTGVEMPDAPPQVEPIEKPPRTAGALSRYEGGRVALERELLTLIIADKGESDRASEISESLGRRAVLCRPRNPLTTKEARRAARGSPCQSAVITWRPTVVQGSLP